MSADRQKVVAWSGGADSTMLLTERAHASTRAVPALAITLEPPFLPKYQLASQRAAQKRYLAWAKKAGLHVRHMRLGIIGEPRLGDATTQASLWIAHIAPYLPRTCSVAFGYIQKDDFWHRATEARDALAALAKVPFDTCDWAVEYPYEWSSKGTVLTALKGWGVPADCWWTCEGPRRVGVACGKCVKCRELRTGMAEARKK